jgi:hypothetical protein
MKRLADLQEVEVAAIDYYLLYALLVERDC